MHDQAREVNPNEDINNRLRQRAAGVSLAYNAIFTLAKLVGAFMTGSISLLSEAIHSGTDVIASFIAFVSVRAAAVPPDEEHPYGHGKIESLAGFGESILLLLMVFYLIYEGIHRLFTGVELQNLDVGVAVIALSTISSFVVSRYVTGVAKKTDSLALRSNGQHLTVDFVTSLGVLAALVAVKLTGWKLIDPLLAIGLALWMAVGAWKLARLAFEQLIDRRLPEEEIQRIERILREDPRALSFHRLRTRRSGYIRYIDLHIVVPSDWSLQQAHETADDLEKRIERILTPAQVVIHVDPYDPEKAAKVSDSGTPLKEELSVAQRKEKV
ncbi:MAG: cation transporter [Fimbriimonadia bacterium]|nr:cation transporter [Fimbriimonadia bacterium]